jgi:predicted DCC family thiol-disulfide oxidoreductase YuxK
MMPLEKESIDHTLTRMFEVFYDGDCPLCMREINMLMRMDQQKRIQFTNIADPSFDPVPLGVTWETLMKKIHGRMPDGELVEGVEVFRQLYDAVGFNRLVAASRLPGVSGALNLGYQLFAKNRLRFTGRCKDGCDIPARRAET